MPDVIEELGVKSKHAYQIGKNIGNEEYPVFKQINII